MEIVLVFAVVILEIIAFQIVEGYAKKRNKSVEMCKFDFSEAVCVIGMLSTFIPIVFHLKTMAGVCWFFAVISVLVMHCTTFPSQRGLLRWRAEENEEMEELKRKNARLYDKLAALEKENASLKNDLEYYQSEE